MQSMLKFFHTNEWEHGGQDSVNPHEGICDVLESMRSIPGLFKVFTNFGVQNLMSCAILSALQLVQMHDPQVTFVSYPGVHLN